MKTFNKTILLGIVLVSFIFTCSTFPLFTGTFASLSDMKHTNAEINIANMFGLSDFNSLGNNEDLQNITGKIRRTDNFLGNVSSASNLTNNSSTAEKETVNLNKTVNLNETSENRMVSGSSSTTTDQDNREYIIPAANFGSNLTSGWAPLTVQFTDFSENAVEWNWDFGDESYSNEQNPVHTYSTEGNYTIKLTVSNENGKNSTSSSINVMKPDYPVANFSTNVSEGIAPLTVQFTDFSENAAEWNWDFGDGTTSTEQNPVHTYSTAGNYTATLTVSNADSTNSTFYAITVLQPAPPVANFRSNVTSGYTPLTVQLTDLSENTAEWNWDFGDGITSTEQNPVHTYSTAGTYTVTLTASSADGQNIKTGEISVSKNSVDNTADKNSSTEIET